MVSPKSLAGLADLLQQPHLKDNARLDPLSLVVRKKRTYVVQNAVSSSAVHLCLVIFFLWFFPWRRNSWSSQSQCQISWWSRWSLTAALTVWYFASSASLALSISLGTESDAFTKYSPISFSTDIFGNISQFSRIQSSFPLHCRDRTAGWLSCAVFV